MNKLHEIRVPNSLPRIAADITVSILLGIALTSFALESSASETPPRTIDAPPEALENLPENRTSSEPWNSGWALGVDNDLLSGSGRDRDYSAGLMFSSSGMQARERTLSVDGALGWVDRVTRFSLLLTDELAVERGHAMQLGVLLFTPDNILTDDAIADDRPYANLMFVGNSRFALNRNRTTLYQSTLTVGLLGTGIGETLQRAIHDLTEGDDPQGYSHQISDGGELTARYSVARHALLATGFSTRSTYDVRLTLSASAGYLTEASAALGLRWGRINSPWWTAVGEHADYPVSPTPIIRQQPLVRQNELYFSAGFRVVARAYNSFLQGQLRDSSVTFSRSQLEPLLLESWLGLTMDFDDLRLQYAIRHQQAELKTGTGARSVTWAGVTVSRSF